MYVWTIAFFAIGMGLVLLYAPGFDWKSAKEPSSTMKSQQQQQQQQQQRDGDYYYNLVIPGSDSTIRGKLFLPNNNNMSFHDDDDDDNNNKEKKAQQLPPVIILAHGMGLIQDFQLHSYVQAFTQEAGLAVVTFDYPTFGASTGTPRHDIIPWNNWKHIDRVVSYLQQEQSLVIDVTRMALWGTSLGGGHVLDYVNLKTAATIATTTTTTTTTTAGDNNNENDSTNTTPQSSSFPIRAVVANVPCTQSGLETVIEMLLGDFGLIHFPGLIKILLAILKQVLTQQPWYIPLTGPPGSAAILQNPGDEIGYGKFYKNNKDDNNLVVLDNNNNNQQQEEQQEDDDDNDQDLSWRNAATTFSAFRTLFYRPLNHVSSSSSVVSSLASSSSSQEEATRKQGVGVVPTLLVAAELDTLCPLHAVEKMAQLLPQSQLVVLNGTSHFDVYYNESLQQSLSIMIPFLNQHLFS